MKFRSIIWFSDGTLNEIGFKVSGDSWLLIEHVIAAVSAFARRRRDSLSLTFGQKRWRQVKGERSNDLVPPSSRNLETDRQRS